MSASTYIAESTFKRMDSVMSGVKGQIQARGVQRRREILDAAVEQFGRNGSRGVSVAEVAAAAGVTAAGVLHHFQSKDRLLLAAIDEYGQREAERFRALVAPGGLEMLRNLVQVAEANLEKRTYASTFIVLAAESTDPTAPGHGWFVERNRRVRALYEQGLEAGKERGELRPDLDSRSLAWQLHAFLDGVHLDWLLEPDLPLVQVTKEYLDAMVRDLAAPGRRG
jgi:AcrR family transcriptional regulator